MDKTNTVITTLDKIDAGIKRMKEHSAAVRWFLDADNSLSAYDKALKLAAQAEKTTLLTRVLPAYTGNPRCFDDMESLTDIARLNAGVRDVTSAILFGQSEDIALKTLLESDTSPRAENRFDNIYRRVHFVPMNEFGIQQLRFLSVPDWNEQLLDILFDPEERSYNRGAFEYDAYIDGVYIYSHLDSDIARLIRFKPYAVSHSKSCEVLCFHHQMPFLRKYLGQDVKLKLIDINSVEDELGPERRNLFER